MGRRYFCDLIIRTDSDIDKGIARLRLGLLGEWDDVGDGVIELIFKNTGPGYRIYLLPGRP
jgi:putative component of toxin-antitoxin plasmid stabilization module